MQESKFPSHPLYKYEPERENADAISWVLTDKKSELKLFSYKFPEMKDHELRAKVLHVGLCQSDCLHGRCHWGDHTTFPFSPGHEVIGEVTKVGENVQNFKVGDIIGIGPQRDQCGGCDGCESGNENLCEQIQLLYDPYFGGYGTHIQITERQTYKIPEGMPLDIIAPLLCAGLTVFSPISRWQEGLKWKKTGLKVGVFGIGGLGHLAVKYLNAMGHKVTAFSSSFKKEKELKEMGAYDVSSSIDVKSLSSEGIAHTYDMVLNTLFLDDKEQFNALQNTVKKGGTIIQIGLPAIQTSLNIDIMNLVFRQISFQGSMTGSYQEMEKMLEFSAKNKIYPIVEKYTFEEFPKAFDVLENGRPKFRAVVNVEDWAKKNGFNK